MQKCFRLSFLFVWVMLQFGCVHAPQKAKLSQKDSKPAPVKQVEAKPGRTKSTNTKLTAKAVDTTVAQVRVAQSNRKNEKKKTEQLGKDDKIYFELLGEKYDRLSETEIYSKIVDKYRINDRKAVASYLNLLSVRFPNSVHIDNALYMAAMLDFSEKQYGSSLAYLNRIIEEYPLSNKAVSAHFAKGVLYRKMGLKDASQTSLKKVIRGYPGSPESLRADTELKLLE